MRHNLFNHLKAENTHQYTCKKLTYSIKYIVIITLVLLTSGCDRVYVGDHDRREISR